MFSDAQKHLFVSEFADLNSFYGERVGMTFWGYQCLIFLSCWRLVLKAKCHYLVVRKRTGGATASKIF